jgi:hypothetical protein
VTIHLPRNSGVDRAHHQLATLLLTTQAAREAQADNVTGVSRTLDASMVLSHSLQDVALVALPRVHLYLKLHHMTRLTPVAAPTVVFLATVIPVLLRRLSHLLEVVAPGNIHREMAVILQILPVATGGLD